MPDKIIMQLQTSIKHYLQIKI